MKWKKSALLMIVCLLFGMITPIWAEENPDAADPAVTDSVEEDQDINTDSEIQEEPEEMDALHEESTTDHTSEEESLTIDDSSESEESIEEPNEESTDESSEESLTESSAESSEEPAQEQAAEQEKTVAPKKITITNAPQVIAVNGTAQLTVEITPAEAKDAKIVWTSTDPKIATVDEKGLVSGVHYGRTTITAQTEDGKVKAEASIFIGFADVLDTDKVYYYNPVYWAVDKVITKGYKEDNTFRPQAECTRAHAVTFLWRLAGEPQPKTTTPMFKDVSSSAYYYKAVQWAAENEITKGYKEDNTFRPDAVCEREHLVTFLWRYAGKPSASGNTFKDVYKSDYYYTAVLWATQTGITHGYPEDKTFRPKVSCLRQHAMTFIYRYAMKYPNQITTWTQPTTQPTEPAQKNLVIVLDPGHGGDDVGARSYGHLAYERDLNLKISQFTRDALLQYKDVTVYLTRNSNSEYYTLEERAEKAKQWGADLMVSQHLNSSTNLVARGSEVYVSVNPQYKMQNLAELIMKKLVALGLTERYIQARPWSSSITNIDYYGIIRYSVARGIPTVLIENAFISSYLDYTNYLNTDAKLKTIAEANAKAIAEYYGLSK